MAWAVVATFHKTQFDDAYVCDATVSRWRKQSVLERGPDWTVNVRNGFKTEKAAFDFIEREYPL